MRALILSVILLSVPSLFAADLSCQGKPKDVVENNFSQLLAIGHTNQGIDFSQVYKNSQKTVKTKKGKTKTVTQRIAVPGMSELVLGKLVITKNNSKYSVSVYSGAPDLEVKQRMVATTRMALLGFRNYPLEYKQLRECADLVINELQGEITYPY